MGKFIVENLLAERVPQRYVLITFLGTTDDSESNKLGLVKIVGAVLSKFTSP